MTTDAGSGRIPAKRRIVDAIVADIAVRRSVPAVFLLDAAGTPTAWPRGTSGLPTSLRPLIDMYFAQNAAHRVTLTELVEIDGTQMQVRIMPYHADGRSQYAVLLEPFILRSRSAHGSEELTTAT